ncbi:MAG: hypothetical protein J7521_04385 [Caulobacter sp.]|nr:hypothetical protein [Caulobacter sp.]
MFKLLGEGTSTRWATARNRSREYVPSLCRRAFAGRRGEAFREFGRDGRAQLFHRRDGAFDFDAGVIADAGQFGDPRLQGQIGHVGDAFLNRVEPSELGVGVCHASTQFGDMCAASIDPFLPAVDDVLHQRRQAIRVVQAVLDMLDDGLV